MAIIGDIDVLTFPAPAHADDLLPETAALVQSSLPGDDLRLRPAAVLTQFSTSVFARMRADRLRLRVRLNGKLSALTSIVYSADAAPPQQAYDVFDYLSAQADEQLAKLNAVLESDVAAFNQLLRESQVAAVII